MSKKPFQVGDRVCVYAGLSRVVGVIAYIDGEAIKVERADGRSHMIVHPKQCRRLKPRKKPAPEKAERVARRVWWIAACPSGKVSEIAQDMAGLLDGPGPIMLPPCSNQDMPTWVRSVELRSGEIVISCESLARELAEAFDIAPGEYSPVIAGLLNRLGLPESEKGKP